MKKVKNIYREKYDWKQSLLKKNQPQLPHFPKATFYMMELGIDVVDGKEEEYVVLKVYFGDEDES